MGRVDTDIGLVPELRLWVRERELCRGWAEDHAAGGGDEAEIKSLATRVEAVC